MVKQKLFYLGYEARLHRDRDPSSDVVHFTITHVGEREILAWGQELGREAAEAAAEECIRDLAAEQTEVA